MNNVNLVEKIKQLGFSEYEAKCYLALLERDSLSVSEVSRLAGVPRPNAYEALEKLMAKGISVTIAGKMKRYAASDPWFIRERSIQSLTNTLETEIEELERKRKEIIERKKSVQDTMEIVIGELDSRFKESRTNGAPLEYIEILKDPYRIHHKFMQLCSEATNEIVMFTKPPYASSTKKHKDEQDNTQFAALERGVKIRSIYEIPTKEAEQVPFIEAIPESVKHGEEARVIEELPIKLAVFDQKIVLYVMEDPFLGKLSVTTIVAENSALAKSFTILFEVFWEKARNYYIVDNNRIDLIPPDRENKDRT
jgi:HTH-type transcriptional regulator, sugar sensing transcriptional regulator